MKRGSSGFANAGVELYSERLCADVPAAMGNNHVPYTLRHHHGKFASDCPLFTSEEIGFVPAFRLLKGRFGIDDVLTFLNGLGGQEPFREMLVMDAVCANVDRHAGNYGFTVRNDTGEILGLAPLFDHTMAALPYLMEGDDVVAYLSHQAPKIGGGFVVVAYHVGERYPLKAHCTQGLLV